MGKIHDALKRAEEQRAKGGGAPGGAAAPAQWLDRPQPPPRRPLLRRARGPGLRDARKARAVLTDSESAVAEQYRSLRARVQSLRRGRAIRSLAITSADPREGKTTTAVNLALCFGLELEHATCLVDADLRTPGVHRALPQMPEAGLAELLEGHADLEDALVEIPETRLQVIPVRAHPAHPSELLASRRMEELVRELHERFETTVIDTPPILALPDATTLVDLCDAAILVVQSGVSSRDDVERALERIDRTKLLGTVLNRTEDVPKAYAYYYGGGGRR